MRIWIVNHYACSPKESGGTRHYSLAKELARRGHEVLIFASSFVHYAERQRSGSDRKWTREQVEDVPFVWVKSPRYAGNGMARVRNMLVFSARTSSVSRSAAGASPDVVIGSSPHLFAAYAALRLARRHGVPFILEVRDLWPDSLVAVGSFRRNHPFVLALEFLEGYLYKRSDAILALLPAASKRLQEKGAEASKVHWLPNGVDFGMVPKVRPAVPKDKIVGIYAGAHGRANMLDGLLDAALLLKNDGWGDKVEIQMVGDGPEKARLRERARSDGIHMVKFLDAVRKTEIYGLVEQADFCLQLWKDSPLYRSGISPNKLFDYMAAARPAILASESPMSPIALAQSGITIPPEDPRSLAEAIKAMASLSEAERWEAGLRGRRYVEDRHNVGSLAARLESILEEAVVKGPRIRVSDGKSSLSA